MPNAAETALAEMIRRQGKAAFDAALPGFLGRAKAPDNLLVLACGDAAPPLVLFSHADDARVFAAREIEAAERIAPVVLALIEAGTAARLVAAVERTHPILLSPR